MFETGTVGRCLVWKLKWGDHAPLWPMVAMPLHLRGLQLSVIVSDLKVNL